MKKIVIVRGNEFKVYDSQVYDSEIDRSEDIFEEIYQKAREQKMYLEQYSKKILGLSGTENGERSFGVENSARLSGENKSDVSSEYLNNIIAFCGERGQGKSSAMQHFVGELRREEDKEVLQVIDPTAMEMAHDIVDIIISQLFAYFRKNRKKNEALDMELTQAFQKVHRNMSVLKNADKFIEREYAYNSSLQNLSDITDSMEMRADIIRLVRLYLKFRDKEMLVIPIDDLDLNLDHVYKVAEQLRKYFMIPKVMIVMAVNMEQLTLCVEKELLKELTPLKESKRWNIQREARNMSGRYMEKLIPFPRRMQLPDIHAIAEDGENAVEVIYKTKDTEDEKDVIFDSKKQGIEKGILNLIFEKTGLVYVAKPNEVHPIVPSTLRELVNLISLLGDMGEDQEENLEAFEQYFCRVWLEHNLTDEHGVLVREIAATQLNDLHNDAFFLLYEMLKKRIEVSRRDLSGAIIESLPRAVEQVYEDMQGGYVRPDNGDLLNCLVLLKQGNKSGVSKLAMAIMTVFSIRMLKLKAAKKWEVLYDITAEYLFGDFLLIRQEALEGGKLESRTQFEYQVKIFMEDIIGQPLPSAVGEIRKETEDDRLARALVLMGAFSDFKDADGNSRKLVSNNYQIATRAVFDINQVFRSGISWERVKEKLSLNMWGIDETLCRKEYDSIYQAGTWRGLVCNMEELLCLAQYVHRNRGEGELRNTARETDYYRHFFESVQWFLTDLHEYIPSLDMLKEIDAERLGRIIALMRPMASEKRAKMINEKPENEENEEYAKINVSFPITIPAETVKMPAYNRNTKWAYMKKTLEEVNAYINKHENEITKDVYDRLKAYQYELLMAMEGKDTKDRVGTEGRDLYNKLKTEIAGLEK